MKLFVYQWHVGDENDENDATTTQIRAYGLTENGETVCLHIKGFQPWIFLEVDVSMPSWTDYKNMIKNKVLERYKGPVNPTFSIMYKQKLYFCSDQKKEPFFKIYFPSLQSRRNAVYSLQRHSTRLLGKRLQFLCHEQDASPLLQMTCRQDVPTTGWIEFHGKKTPPGLKITALEHEYIVDHTRLERVQDENLGIPPVCVLSFDIETYSTNPNRMPDATIEGDCIFQISCVLESKGSGVKKYLLTLGRVELGKRVDVQCFSDEKALLLGFQMFLREKNPHVVIGYNIFGFDIPYMVERAKLHGILDRFDVWGIPSTKHSPEKEIKWSSSAYSYQNFRYLDAEGRVFVDMLPVVKREYKFSNYKLKTVSTFFLGETKDPLTHHDIFDAYRDGVLSNKTKKITECGKYCVQDSYLVLQLFKVLETWIGLIEMSSICHVPIMSLFTQGQQIKVFSQVYKKCMDEGILVQSYNSLPKTSIFDTIDTYSGAYVFPPKPGIYNWVIPFDFSSLYPTTIIAYNIDYSSLVIDESVPDDKCHVIEWEDHIGCEHDTEKGKKERVVCQKYRFRFCKSPMGVIPGLLQTLLAQRAETKKRIKSTPDKTLRTVLDKRQLAYKVSANSMYGAMGVKKGYLPFMPGAMSTTAMGRISIQKAAEYVKSKHHGQLIYGDSVSPDTPLYLRCGSSSFVDIMTIEEFFEKFKATPYPQFRPGNQKLTNKEQSVPNDDEMWSVLGKTGWSPVKRVVRHTTCKSMYKIFTTSGFVHVTEDHSLVLADGRLIKPSKLELRDQLLCIPEVQQSFCPILLENVDCLKGLTALSNNMLVLPKNIEMKEYARLYWLLKGKWNDLRFVYRDDDILIDLENANATPRGVVTQIIATTNQQETTVYDIETQEGRFHCGVGDVVVKNTDSIYCHFHTEQNAKTIWDLAKVVESEFVSLFPRPMKLVFEEKIYKTFLILTKKRYMAYTCNEDGSIDKDLTIRGVLLARRDNCRWVRRIYEIVVRDMMDGKKKLFIMDIVNSMILELFHWHETKISDFIVSKLVGKDYKIKALPEDLKKCEKRCEELHLTGVPEKLTQDMIKTINKRLETNTKDVREYWLQQYIEKVQPPHVQLALKMKRRGFPVEAGSRIEYLTIESPSLKAKLNERLEDPLYFQKHRDLLRLDRLYYVQALSKPLDQLLETVFGVKGYTKYIWQIHLYHKKIIQELDEANSAKIEFVDENGVAEKEKKNTKKKNSFSVSL